MLLSTSILLLLPALISCEDCRAKDYGFGGTVCVCDSKSCDTLPRPEKVDAPKYLKFTSNQAGLRFLKEEGTFREGQGGVNQITVDPREEFQEILGWGGAFTDATGINLRGLDEDGQQQLLRAYFSEDGLEYSLCRVPIGGTDFSLRSYSYDNSPTPDPTLANFNLTSEDYEYKLPYIKKALGLNPNLTFFSSAWTAPKWMKTNEEYTGGYLKPEYYQTWAEYFLKFLDAYKNEGVNFWGITTGNEPSLALINSQINSVGWLPEEMGKFIAENLGPSIRKSQHSGIKIMALDDQRLFLPWYLDLALENKTARDFIDGIAMHWYWDDLIPPSFDTATHENFPEKFILSTEACNGDRPFDVHVELGSWDRGQYYAEDIIKDLSNWVQGWVDWNMALNETGGPTYIGNLVDSPIIVNATSGEFYKQPTFYALGHFSKFIPKGSRRISANYLDDVPVIALKRPDNATVLVILNMREEEVPVTVADESRGSTDVKISGKSITTFLYW